MLSAYLLKENNINYIITSNFLYADKKVEPIKIFDLSGHLIKEIKDSNESTLKLHNYYDQNLSKNYIITANQNYVKSYDYTLNKIYHKYFDIKNDKFHSDLIIKCDESIIKLIESCNDGYIRIWNFHSGLMLNKINMVNYKNQYCLCLRDNQYLFVACILKIILIDYQNNKIIETLCYNDNPLTMEKVYVPKYGDCLISQGMGSQPIKIWLIKQ